MKVKLNRDWKQNKEGDVLSEKDRPFHTLQFLIRQGWAIDVTNEALEPPTMDNTKKEIEAYLRGNGIQYDEYATKAELLELI